MAMLQSSVSTRTAARPAARPSVRPFGAVRPRVVATRATAAPEKATATKEWSALVCSCDFFFNDTQNESIAEQMRERVRYYKEQNREWDFFIVPEPKWLDAKYPQLAKQVKRPSVALISTDKEWITYMKVRLDRVMRIELKDMADSEVLAVGGTVPDYPAPAKWTAPYARYTPGWWNVFIPKN